MGNHYIQFIYSFKISTFFYNIYLKILITKTLHWQKRRVYIYILSRITPNFSVSLSDKNILSSLLLQIKTHNYKMFDGSIPVALIYKVHYKAMMSAFNTKNIQHSKKGETLLLQTDLSRSNIM